LFVHLRGVSATATFRSHAAGLATHVVSAECLVEWIDAERGRFVPWLSVSMVAGVLLYFLPAFEPPWWWPVVGVAAGMVVTLAGRRHRGLLAAGLLIVAAALGYGSALFATMQALPTDALPSTAVVLQATVRGVDAMPDGRRLVLQAVHLAPDAAPLRRIVRVRLKPGDDTPVAAGDRIELRALLRPPSGPAYPGGWDQQRDAWFSGLAGGGMALNPIRIIEHAPPEGLAPRIQALRDAIAARAMAALPGPTGAIAATLLSGTTRSIPDADRAAFRDSGLAHLLAVAGLHIGIVMGLFMVGTRLAFAAWPHAALHWPTKAVAAGVALAAGFGYLILTGAHVPILRSFTMAALVTLAVFTGRRALSMRGLALAAAALVLIAPQEVVGVSFQMSFAAVAALIAGYEALRPVLNRLRGPGWRRVAMHLATLLLTSLLAGTASAPYGAYHFGQFQIYYVVANMVAVPLTAFWVLPLGIVALALMPFGLDGLAFTPMGWGLDAILWVARCVASWPAATIASPTIPGWGLAVFSLGLAWLCLWRTRVRLAGVVVMAAGLLSPMIQPPPDVLISSDARLIAWRGPEGYALLAGPGASWFVRDAWRSRLGVGVWRPLDAGCDGDACRMGGALLLRTKDARPDCAGVQIVISPEPARGVCPDARLIDRFTVWRDGAHAVWIGGDATVVLSDRMDRGTRPWVPPPPTPRRRPSDLPVAPAEVLPTVTED
jgi:competence protein ComEC